MGSLNPGQAQIVKGTFNYDECTTELDLIKNQAIMPNIKKMMNRVDKRQLTTILTSGGVGPYGMNLTVDEKFAKPRKGDLVGSSSIQFAVMGSIKDNSVVISQYGSSQADGTFQLVVQDNLIYKGQNAIFGNAGYYRALCMTDPQKIAAGWLYTYKNVQGEVFNYAIHAAPNASGVISIAGVDTNYSEGSEKGYSRSKHPDRFILDMTIQRKTVNLTGDAMSDVLWYEYMGEKGITRGWKYEAVAQAEALFAWENEFQKIFGISSMKDANGNRLSISNNIDPQTGLPITAGDGIFEQVSGGAELYGTGVNGEVTASDFIEAMGMVTVKSNSTTNGVNLVFMTGLQGFYNFQKVAGEISRMNNATIFQQEKGGASNVKVGFSYSTIVYGDSSVTVVVHPLFDDPKVFQATGSDGKSLMSNTYIGGDIGDSSNPNMEIIAKGAFGNDRSEVKSELNGMSGAPGMVTQQKDAWTWQILKQDLLAIYNTSSWIILRKSS